VRKSPEGSVNIVNPGMLGVRCSPGTALPCPCFAGWWVFKNFKLSIHLKQSSSSIHSTPKNGCSVHPSTFDGALPPIAHFLAKMGGDFTPPFLIILSLSSNVVRTCVRSL
jgi:hypothetical protein